MAVDEPRTRLHITPFNPTLFDSIIPKSVQSNASHVSYHQLETFPERAFGYVELPSSDAEKLRKKLNGLTLRGAKMSIEEARPKKKRSRDDTAIDEPEKTTKRAKKEKRKEGVIPGHELPSDRHVKRGWTEPGKPAKVQHDPKDSSDKKRKRESSKYTKDKEVLFKTKTRVQPAKTDAKLVADSSAKSHTPRTTPILVHEFEKTRKTPSFLRNSVKGRATAALTFDEGRGWVDEEGTVVEAVKKRPARDIMAQQELIEGDRTRVSAPSTASAPRHEEMPKAEVLRGKPKSLSFGHAVATIDQEPERTSNKVIEPSAPRIDSTLSDSDDDSADSSSESSSESGEDGSSDSDSSASASSGRVSDTTSSTEESDDEDATPKPVNKQSPLLDDVVAAPTVEQKEIHPLEALYKRPKDGLPRLAPIDTGFNFFGGSDGEPDDDDEIEAPRTPSNQLDRHERDMRSAAPTPDTAAIGRRSSFPFGHPQEEDEDEEMEDGGIPDPNQPDAGLGLSLTADSPKPESADNGNEESEFAKWFWEHRGETNRAWKRRRREVLKQKRQRDNRRLTRHVV